MVNIVYFADIQLDPEKLKNRQILLVLTVFICYYGTLKDKHDVAVPFFFGPHEKTFYEEPKKCLRI